MRADCTHGSPRSRDRAPPPDAEKSQFPLVVQKELIDHMLVTRVRAVAAGAADPTPAATRVADRSLLVTGQRDGICDTAMPSPNRPITDVNSTRSLPVPSATGLSTTTVPIWSAPVPIMPSAHSLAKWLAS